MIALKSSHIYLKSELVEKIFGKVSYAYIVYDSELQLMLVTPVSNQWFLKIYENPMQFLLKSRNLDGDKTLAIHEILIDNDLDISNRPLEFRFIEKTKLIKILF